MTKRALTSQKPAKAPKRAKVDRPVKSNLTKLKRELAEALQRQAAATEVLEIISHGGGDLEPVFEKLLENATRLCGAGFGIMNLFSDGMVRQAAFYNLPSSYTEEWRNRPYRPHPESVMGTVARLKQTVYVDDIRTRPAYRQGDTVVVGLSDTAGARSYVGVPMLRDGELIGMISIYRQEVRPFSLRQVELIKNFASQAVIAIENTRLFNETKAALEQQTATSEVLQAIGSSMADTQPVFERILDSVERLFDCKRSLIFLAPGDGLMHLVARRGMGTASLDAVYPQPIGQTAAASVLGERRQKYIPDAMNGADVPESLRRSAQATGNFSVVMTPMLWEGQGIGMISVTREPNAGFTLKELGLLKTFADQAVIAIENARLFNEVQAKTRDLTEALTYQTGSSNILKVIASSPTDVGPVLKAIVENACELCEADDAVVNLRDGDDLRYGAQHGTIPIGFERRPINRNWVTGRAVLDKVPIHLHDVLSAEGAEFPEAQQMSRHTGMRTILSVPLLRENESIGAIILRRTEVNPFNDKQIALLQTFADQAVIAIENARLFNETKEALERQTATADILKIIASSPTDVGPVLKAIVESACELCDAPDALVRLREGDGLYHGAHHGPIPVGFESRPLNRDFITSRAVVDKVTIHVHDVLSAEGDEFPEAQRMSRGLGTRTFLSVPLLRENESIGAIALRRTEVNPFSEKQIALLQTFADQAVIAIGNVRLFEEVQAKTADLSEALEQQTATADVLKVISSSPGDLRPVFTAMLENATRICEAQYGVMFKFSGGAFHVDALLGVPPAFAENLQRGPRLPRPGTALGRLCTTKEIVHITDVRAEQAYIDGDPQRRATADLGGARTFVAVPMLKDNELVGALTIYRQEVRPFTAKQIELVTSFANQAVIAIENVRLVNELRERTRDLTQSLDDLRTAQDRLVQTEKLASLGQLTAGIAHEIKNPLNFVNNFSALSAELTDELNDVLKPVALSDKIRQEVDELTRLLKDNLEKVVQHGKRADSIVKNMLLHSREGSGEHRPTDINALLDESLNLAYHGARAEKREFNVTLQRDFDAAAGTIEVFPQEITRVFLNLISNGFYAVTKRKTENGSSDFEPAVTAATRNLGSSVEIRIRDNGTGIPAEVKEKMFNPFFTTKPAGEGTGLGLSMSHDIVVKQHGGSIDVETEPGQFTEFRIVLPRTSIIPQKRG